jgi:hypothetical protein
MGWNSYDCFLSAVTEAQVLANAQYMADHLAKAGWRYIVVDYCWFHPEKAPVIFVNPEQDAQMRPRLAMDGYGRLLPDASRFPSAANGRGFKPLADHIHALGLKFGIHVLRGVPRQAVGERTPVKGAEATAPDIADVSSTCPWINTCYGLEMRVPAAQAYLNSCFDLYASWGVDFVKVDDLSSPYHLAEVEGYRAAIDQCGREMVFSLSPGNATPLDRAEHLKSVGNMWRIVGDLWDNWHQVEACFACFAAWAPHAGPGHWPDGDMLPLGTLSGPRPCRLIRDEQRTVMTLWSMARGPLFFGGDLTRNDPWTLSLLTNEEVLGVNQSSVHNRQLFRTEEQVVWAAQEPGGPNQYLALFNTGSAPAPISVLFSQLGLPHGESRMVRDLWERKDLGTHHASILAEVPAHGARLLKLLPGAQ